MLIYVDDIIVTGSNNAEIQKVLELLHRQFPLEDLGELSYFLAIQVTRLRDSLHMYQEKYVKELL